MSNTNKRPRGPMGHGPGGKMMPGEKAKDFKGTMRKLFRYMAKYKVKLFLCFCLQWEEPFSVL